MKCLQCGKEFEAKRADARYCSAGCRQIAKRLSVTNSLAAVTDNPDIVTDKLSVTEIEPTLSGRDDIWSEEYDISEEGFQRRNKNWGDFKPQFRADTLLVCKRINLDHLAEIAEHDVMRAGIEGKSAVRGNDKLSGRRKAVNL